MIIPSATYRVQFSPDFSFQKAKETVPSYLQELGISHLYASPVFQAHHGSAHGYDVVDPTKLNKELGTEEEFISLVSALKDRNILWIQDIVPNHMAFDSENVMLMDVLEKGARSEYFTFFDIDWNHFYESLRGRLLTPVLGSFYAEALEQGEIQLVYDEQGLAVRYYELRLPLKVDSYSHVLERGIAEVEKSSGSHPDFPKLLGAINLFRALLPSETALFSEQFTHAKGMLWVLYNESAFVKGFIENNLAFFNGEKGDAQSFNALDDLLSQQLFRLSYWKVAAEEINYRRFFTINTLISLRVEEEQVFEYLHALVLKYVETSMFQGLRIDHLDGLFDPTHYIELLRKRNPALYIVAEKILAPGEELRKNWPIQGTTGYDFLNYVNGLFCRKEYKRQLDRIYRRFSGLTIPYEDLVWEKKRLIISRHIAGNIDNLAHFLKNISADDRYGRDITLYGLRRALVEIMAMFPVYRTYINSDAVEESDGMYIEKAVFQAKEKLPDFAHEFNFLEKFLLLKFSDSLNEQQRQQRIRFIMSFQQHTAPLMAKGFEDTILYIYNPLLSLNEVGSAPERFGVSLSEFHSFAQRRLQTHPHSFNATATHDTKRGEDARARINVLSEMPGEWSQKLKLWSRMNKKKKTKMNDEVAPDNNDEYFLYQTLIGAMSGTIEQGFKERLQAYMLKAVREAKRHTGWVNPALAYEQACTTFIEQLLDTTAENEFLADFVPFQRRISFYGLFNSLSQLLLKITSPGVPDFYQGTEVWDFVFVDPDNRRPVDFGVRAAVLKEIKEQETDFAGLFARLWQRKEDGGLKLFLMFKALKFRRENVRLFQEGEYFPLEITGSFRESVIAFARRKAEEWALVVVPRFLLHVVQENQLPHGREVWQDTTILVGDNAPKNWREAITGKDLQGERIMFVGDILNHFPVALLFGRT